MRKTLVAVAFAGAALAPAAALTTAATLATAVAPTAAIAAPKAKAKLKPGSILKRHQRLRRAPLLRRAPHLRQPDFQIARRCFWPRVSIHREIRRLRHRGYYRVRYAGRRFFRPRCAMFLHFNACRGAKRYLVMVRYINHRRFVIALNRGRCFPRGHIRRP